MHINAHMFDSEYKLELSIYYIFLISYHSYFVSKKKQIQFRTAYTYFVS